MAIIIYKCDTCDREIELNENRKGLDVIGRCTITEGCRGKLYHLARKADFVRGKFPEAVEGLNDWTQRKALYNHKQTIASAEWNVKHNLGTNPDVQVLVERSITATQVDLIEITPETISIVNENELLLTFNGPEAGLAQCIARSSKPVVDVVTTTAVDVVENFQITASAELTIATLDETVTNNITITYVTPDGNTYPLVYAVDDVPALTSPWSNSDKVLINNKAYTVRSFNIIKTEMTNGTVVDGSSFFFDQVDVGPNAPDINSDDILILLANSPYEIFDKIEDTFIDVGPIGIDEAATSFYYDSGQLFASTSLFETTYPLIRAI